MIKTMILSIGILMSIESFGQSLIAGKIVDEKLQQFIGDVVINKSTNEKTISDKSGFYQIKGNRGDTITFECIGVTHEKRIISDLGSRINVILMDKSVNCLGAPWTQRQYKKADRLINRKYNDLYKQAERIGIWKI